MTKYCKRPIIIDGGMGRELQRIGAPFVQPQWSAQALIETPHLVSQVHRSFIQAGANIITSNTYALVPFHIGETCFNEQGAKLIKLAASLARECVNQANDDINVHATNKSSENRTLLAGCIPPVLGSYRADLFIEQQAKPLLETLIINQQADVDFWLAETISSIAEAMMIKERTAMTDKTTWMAFTITDDLNCEPTLRSGESVYDAVSKVAGENVSAILFNCSCVEVMQNALVSAQKALSDRSLTNSIQLGVYANNFSPISTTHQANDDSGISKIREDISPDIYSHYALSWLKAGASIIGGCCGISPQHIKKLVDLKNSQENQ